MAEGTLHLQVLLSPDLSRAPCSVLPSSTRSLRPFPLHWPRPVLLPRLPGCLLGTDAGLCRRLGAFPPVSDAAGVGGAVSPTSLDAIVTTHSANSPPESPRSAFSGTRGLASFHHLILIKRNAQTKGENQTEICFRNAPRCSLARSRPWQRGAEAEINVVLQRASENENSVTIKDAVLEPSAGEPRPAPVCPPAPTIKFPGKCRHLNLTS